MAREYSELRNELVIAADGVDYAYRDTGGGEGGVPLKLLHHFRGDLAGCCRDQPSSWDGWAWCDLARLTRRAP